MQLLEALALTLLFILSPGASGSPSPTGAMSSTSSVVAELGLTKLFTGTLQLGSTLNPIAIPGGTRLGEFCARSLSFNHEFLFAEINAVESITSGCISGPGLTATITGGTAFPVFYDGVTIERPDIIVYGNTDKKGSFFATLQGVGSPVDQYVRIVSATVCFAHFWAWGQERSGCRRNLEQLTILDGAAA